MLAVIVRCHRLCFVWRQYSCMCLSMRTCNMSNDESLWQREQCACSHRALPSLLFRVTQATAQWVNLLPYNLCDQCNGSTAQYATTTVTPLHDSYKRVRHVATLS